MITYKMKDFSASGYIDKAVEALEKERIYDYAVSDKIVKDEVSVCGDPGNLEIWIPSEYEFSQYAIDDAIRDMLPYAYTNVKSEGKFFHMVVKGARFTPQQYLKLLKVIISETEFVNIVK